MDRFRQMIASRRSGNEARHGDFLDSMLERDELPSEEKLDDSEIMDNLLTLIIAGQTTTAAAMMWSVKFLDENREAQEKLRVSTTFVFAWENYIFSLQPLSFFLIIFITSVTFSI